MLQNPVVTRKYKVRDKVTGKEYTLEWDKPNEPTELDVEQKLSEAKRSELPETPPITGAFDYKEPSAISKIADKAFTPLTDFAQKTGKKVGDYIQDSPKLLAGTILADRLTNNRPGTMMNMPEALGLGADSFTSPASIGTMGLGTANTILPIAAKNALRAAETPKQIMSANRVAKTAQGVYLANQGVNAGFTAKGAYDFAKDGSIEGAAQALIGAGGLGLGMKNARNIPKTRPVPGDVIPERAAIGATPDIDVPSSISPLPKAPTKYGLTELQFEDDIDRALFAIGNPKGTPRTVTPVMTWLQEQTGLSADELTKTAPIVRASVKEVRDNSTDKIVNVPKIFGLRKPVTKESVQEPVIEQPKAPVVEQETAKPKITLDSGVQEVTLQNPNAQTVKALRDKGYTFLAFNQDKTMKFRLTDVPKVVDEVKTIGDEGVIAPQVVEPQTPLAKPKIPVFGGNSGDLRYNYGDVPFSLKFADDIDKALFTVSNHWDRKTGTMKKKSPNDFQYMQFLKQQFPDVDENKIRNWGRQIREYVRPLAKQGKIDTKGEGGDLAIPKYVVDSLSSSRFENEGTRPRNIAPAPATEPQKLSPENIDDLGEWYRFKKKYDEGTLTDEEMEIWGVLHNKVKDLKGTNVTLTPYKKEILSPDSSRDVYILPDGQRISLDTSLTGGNSTIEYTLKGGEIVTARKAVKGTSAFGSNPIDKPLRNDAHLYASKNQHLTNWNPNTPYNLKDKEGTRPRNINPPPKEGITNKTGDEGILYLGAREPRTVVDYRKEMRESMATTDEPKRTKFLLPDGTRISALGEHAQAVNVSLETNAIKPESYFTHTNNALKQGVVRVIPGTNGGIEIGAPLTPMQAKLIAEDWNFYHKGDLNADAYDDSMDTSTGRPRELQKFKIFENPVNAKALENWSKQVYQIQQKASSDIGAVGDIFDKKQAKNQDPDLFDESDDIREIKIPKGKADKIDKLKSAIRQAKPMQGEQAELYARERAKRFEAVSQVPLKGERGYYERLGKLKGTLPKVQFEPIRDKFTQKEIDFFNDEIFRTIPLETDSIHAAEGLQKLLNGNVPTKSQLTELDKVFGKGFSSEIIELHGGLGAVSMDISRKAINSLKTLKTIYDLSAILNQNKGRMWSPEFYKSIPLTIKAFPSQKVYDQTMAMIKSHPKFERAKKAKLSFLDEHVRNEEMQESYVDKLPGVKASNRAMNLPGNYNRFMTFYRLSDLHDKVVYKPGELELLESKAREKGKVYNDPDDFAIARMLNITTRRGRLPKREITLADGTKRTIDYEQNADDMNLVFFSPRNQWSILQYFNPKNYTTGPKAVQWEFRKSLMAIIGFGLLTTYIKKELFGAKVETDPTSSDFMKAQFGNTRDDPFSGLQQPFVLAMRMATGKSKSIAGNVTDLNKGGFRDRIDVIGSYLRSKESPFSDIVHSALAGSDYLGEKFDLTDPMTLPKKLPPMSMEMAYEIVMDDPNLMALIPLGILGESIQTFTPKKKSSGGSNMKNIKPIRANGPQYVPRIQ